MSKDKFDRIGPLLSAIGEEAAAIVGGDPNGLYLYVEIGDRWIGPSLFMDEGAEIQYFDPSRELIDAIWAAWRAEDPDKRWAVMEYEITGTQFDARFRFPDEVDVESHDVDRREIALRHRYGDKPIVYPPIPERLLRGE